MTEDPLDDLMRAVITSLKAAGITYAVTGSLISGIYGEPIASQDVDIVVSMNERQAKRLAKALPQRFYRSDEALAEAARTHGMANLVDTKTPMKVDLSCMPPGPFRDAVLVRKGPCQLGPGAIEFDAVSPEDIILMKLDWRRDTKSQKQWDNALGVVKIRGKELDWDYLYEQARNLDLEEDLTKLRDEAGI
jgi:hypothetical protein